MDRETDVTKEDVKETIEKHLKNFDPANRKVEIAFLEEVLQRFLKKFKMVFLRLLNEYIKQKRWTVLEFLLDLIIFLKIF